MTGIHHEQEISMHSSRMRTARSSGHPRGSPPGPPPWEQTLWEQTPPGPGPPGADNPPEPGTPQQTPPKTSQPLPVNRIIDACKNITLPQLCCGR